jgi:hypothetical protein
MTELLIHEFVPASELSSATHVTFAMECIGQSFNLPVEQDTKYFPNYSSFLDADVFVPADA